MKGGEIVAEGIPEVVAKAAGSFTERYLAPLLGKRALGSAIEEKAAVE